MKDFIVNRYTCCDKSGIGYDKWEYFLGDFEGDLGYAREHIREVYESWTMYADSYSMRIELDVEPTIEFLESKFTELNESIQGKTKLIHSIMLKMAEMKEEKRKNE